MTSPPPIAPPAALAPMSPLGSSQALPLSPPHSMQITPHNDAKIYVLTADGSSMFLLDQTNPGDNEEPPPYAALHAPLASPSPSRVSVSSMGEIRSPPSRLEFARLHSSASLALERGANAEAGPSRSRASTFSTASRGQRAVSAERNRRARPRLRSTQSGSVRRLQISGPPTESTPLLGRRTLPSEVSGESRGVTRSILCGDLVGGEELDWRSAFKRYWAPIGRGEYWYGLIHLVLLNFPFALVIWLPLLLGTLVGTILLITLPIGATIWWLTLFIARSAARGELRLQSHFHAPMELAELPPPRPIFYRLTSASPPPSPGQEQYDEETGDAELEYVWDKRFLKCSYAMFLDHYSYSALSYFLLIKPLLTLASFLGLVVLLPVGAVSIIGLPIVLRGARRWGKWQAAIAIENLG